MEFILTVLRFLWTLFLVLMVFNLLIVVHEWGHFLAARWRGLKVDRFQVWFGKPLWKKEVNGVQYGLGSIPFGGFVALPQMAPMESIEGKNLDGDESSKDGAEADAETDAEAEKEEVKEPLPPITALDKIIVAFAGPLFSFGLAVVFAVLVWMVGKPGSEYENSQAVGYVAPGSPASEAGIRIDDKILSVDGQAVERIHGMSESVQWYVISRAADEMEFVIDRDGDEMTIPVIVPKAKDRRAAELEEAKASGDEVIEKPWWKNLLALVFDRPEISNSGIAGKETPTVKSTLKHSPANLAGLVKGDMILSANGVPMTNRVALAAYITKTEGAPIDLEVRHRSGETVTVKLDPRVPEVLPTDPDLREAYNRPIVGIIWDDWGLGTISHPSPYDQIVGSVRMMKNTLGAIGNPNSEVKVTHLSSAVGIMDLYYRLFEHPDGWKMVMWFSVVLNINLAILNLLPFPVLDGGHIVMATLEGARGKPLGKRFLEVIQTFFVFLLFGLMLVLVLKDVGAIFNRTANSTSVEAKFLPLDENGQPIQPEKAE